MSDQSQGYGWWQASDLKWYPPELHPEYVAPVLPQPPARAAATQAYAPGPQQPQGLPEPSRRQRRRDRGGTSVWKITLGVCLGIFAAMGVCIAAISGAANKVTSDANQPGTVSIQTDARTCWTATFTGSASGLSQNQQDGCGAMTFDMPKGLGANAIVSDQTAGSSITVVLTVAGKEKARQTSTGAFASVTVSR